jgi:hypothetical protein
MQPRKIPQIFCLFRAEDERIISEERFNEPTVKKEKPERNWRDFGLFIREFDPGSG